MEQTDFLKRLDNFEKLLEQLDWFSSLTDIKEVPFGDLVLPKDSEKSTNGINPKTI